MDDSGRRLDALLDPPCAFAAATCRSVRRWRLAREAVIIAGLVDDNTDVSAFSTQTDGTSTVIDFVHVIASLVTGSKACSKLAPGLHGPYLLSATSGEQWTQTRRAAVPGWGADDSCQLCFDDEGTVNHRFVCKATLPDAGWPTLPTKRQRILQLKGQLS